MIKTYLFFVIVDINYYLITTLIVALVVLTT